MSMLVDSGNPWEKEALARCITFAVHKSERQGFRLFDKVKYKGQECFIFGRRSSGYFDLRKLDGTVVHRSASYKDLKLLSKRKTLLWERREGVSSPT